MRASIAAIAAVTAAGLITLADAAEKVDLRTAPLSADVSRSLQTTAFTADAADQSSQLAKALGLAPDDLTLIRENKTVRTTNLQFNQTYNGIPIWGERITVSVPITPEVDLRMSGVLARGLSKDLNGAKPSLSEEASLAKAKDAFSLQQGIAAAEPSFSNEKSRLVIYLRPTDSRALLSYEVSFFAVVDAKTGEARRPVFLIDATTGETLLEFDALTNANGTGPGGNQKTTKYFYGATGQYPPLDVEEHGADCLMRNANVVTENLNNTTDGSGEPYRFNCFDNTYHEVNGAFSPLNDAHHFASLVYGMYDQWYGTRPLTHGLLMRVHYAIDYENAFWNGQSMTFGDGRARFYPLVSLDVVAHEVSHGYTEQHSGLIYREQSGALNEAFSDMAGEAAESFNKNGAEPDFLVGASIFKQSNGALRYMCDPTMDGISIDSARNYTPGMDVHHSSGVFNKAFCLLAKTKGWDARKAFEIFLVANRDYWSGNTGYTDGAQGALDAATDLGYPAADVIAAFAAVDVNLPTQ